MGQKSVPYSSTLPQVESWRKWILALSIRLSILGVGALSYFNFFITRFEELYFVQIGLSLTIGNDLKSKIF
jgi:hypothetical protein